eukprot:1878452-Amphidinium_carterae.2
MSKQHIMSQRVRNLQHRSIGQSRLRLALKLAHTSAKGKKEQKKRNILKRATARVVVLDYQSRTVSTPAIETRVPI